MLKISQHLISDNLYLIRRQVISGKPCAALLVMRTPVRQYAVQECPPPAKIPKSRKLQYALIGAAILTGSAIAYAKHSPNTRNWLEKNANWAHNIVAVVYQEDETYWEFTVNRFEKAKQMFLDFTFGKEGVTPMDFKSRAEQNLEKASKKKYEERKTYELPALTLEPLYVEEPVIGTPEVDGPSTLVQTEKCIPQKKPPIKITKSMVELEDDMHKHTKMAIDKFKVAVKFCRDYNKALTKVVETPVSELEKKHFSSLAGFRSQRDQYLHTAKESMDTATTALDSLDEMLKEGVAAPPDVVAVTKRYIATFRKDLAEAEKTYKIEVEKGVLSDRFWDVVKNARQAYKQELETLCPGIDLNARVLQMNDNTDLLLMYTIKQIQYLQNELAEIQTVRETELDKAIGCNDEKALIEAKVADMVKKDLRSQETKNRLEMLKADVAHKKRMQDELAKQQDMQAKCITGLIAAKEREIMGRMGRRVSEELEKERVEFKKELAALVGKLQAIEKTLKERAAAEAEARRSQSVWAAAEALLAATRRHQHQADVKDEIKALQKAGQNDKLVKTVLNGIPKETMEKGIATETALRRRFDKLEKTALKVALVGKEGASLPTYFLSWLQSKVLFNKLAEIPRDELNNLPTDFTALDTFDIMQRARYYMDRGNLGTAMVYVNLLQGAPRAAACAWLAAARGHLEIRQAAETVMAHASLAALINC